MLVNTPGGQMQVMVPPGVQVGQPFMINANGQQMQVVANVPEGSTEAIYEETDALETFSDRSQASALARNQLHGGFRKPKVPLDFLASSVKSIK